MTSILHKLPGDDPFDVQLQLSQLRYVTTSESVARSLAENYVSLELVCDNRRWSAAVRPRGVDWCRY